MVTASVDDGVLRALMEICGPQFARVAGAADGVAGKQPRWVAVPPTTDGVADVLRLTAQRGLSVVPRGAGTKIDWGVPPARLDLVLDIGRLAGMRRHATQEPLVETGAGTPLRSVQAVLAGVRRRLPLDPPSQGATVGGVLAADEGGPLRHRRGTPREQLIELRYVTATGVLGTVSGEAVRAAGGRLPSLPGIIVSATLRTVPLPPARLWVTRAVWTPLEAHDAVTQVLASSARADAVELDLPAGESPTSPGGREQPGSLAVLLEGDQASVEERANQLTDLFGGDASAADLPPDWWGRYPFGAGDVALRIEVRPSDLHAVVYAMRDAIGRAVAVRGSAGVGVVHASLESSTPTDRVAAVLGAVRGVLFARGGRFVVVNAPPRLRTTVDLHSR